ADGRIGARRAVGDRDVPAAGHGIAGIRRADASVVAVERRARRADPRLADLGAVAHRRVGARGPVRQRGVLAHAGVARVGRARVVVVAVGGDGARGAPGHRRVDAAGDRVAGVRRAGVVVVAVERRARATRARLTQLGTVARVAVGARGVVG